MSQLRQANRPNFSKLRQKTPENLIQEGSVMSLNIDSKSEISLDESIAAISENKVKTKAHEKQLVSESADANEDNQSDLNLQVPLNSRNDAVYMGTIYMGSPVSQPARVVFDTGSEYLAVTSTLCDDKTSGNFKFKKYDPISGSFV
jgi:hypothetical protein